MHKKRLMTALFVSLFILISGFAYSSAFDTDVFEWVQWNYEQKRIFVKGFLQAEKVVEESLAEYAKKAKDQKVKEGIRKAVESFRLTGSEYPNQVVDALDDFYNDFANKSVPVGKACAIVLKRNR